MRFTSAWEKRAPYRVQCLFFGELSLRYFAATMSVARNSRCRVHCIPIVVKNAGWSARGKSFHGDMGIVLTLGSSW